MVRENVMAKVRAVTEVYQSLKRQPNPKHAVQNINRTSSFLCLNGTFW